MLSKLHGVRESSTSSIWVNARKTALQVFLIWGLFLYVIPMLLVRIEMFASIPSFESTKSQVLGLLLFMAMSTVGLVCAFLFVWYGKGTPLPLDSTTRFVVAGPYRYIRNPMAVAGLGQGLGVAMMLGSYCTVFYVLLGGILWHNIARPWEEADLSRRFGDTYEAYRKRVPLWIPTPFPYPHTVAEHDAEDLEEEAAPPRLQETT